MLPRSASAGVPQELLQHEGMDQISIWVHEIVIVVVAVLVACDFMCHMCCSRISVSASFDSLLVVLLFRIVSLFLYRIAFASCHSS